MDGRLFARCTKWPYHAGSSVNDGEDSSEVTARENVPEYKVHMQQFTRLHVLDGDGLAFLELR
jgi:hypothetical protein